MTHQRYPEHYRGYQIFQFARYNVLFDKSKRYCQRSARQCIVVNARGQRLQVFCQTSSALVSEKATLRFRNPFFPKDNVSHLARRTGLTIANLSLLARLVERFQRHDRCEAPRAAHRAGRRFATLRSSRDAALAHRTRHRYIACMSH